MLNHSGEKKPIECRAASGVELLHLCFREHSRHEHRVLHAAHLHRHPRRIWRGHRLIARLEPARHQRNLISLCIDDALAQSLQLGIRAVRWRPLGHHNCLRMMVHHAGHELDIRLHVGEAGTVGAGLGDCARQPGKRLRGGRRLCGRRDCRNHGRRVRRNGEQRERKQLGNASIGHGTHDSGKRCRSRWRSAPVP